MRRYLIQRLLSFPLVLLAMYACAVLLVMAAPGEGLETGEKDLPPEVLQQRRIAFNFDQPWYQRYFVTWPRRLLIDRDLPSFQYEDFNVVDILRASLPVSLQLGVLALSLAVVLGITAGVISAARPGTLLDHACMTLSLIGISLPTFVVGSGLLMLFALWLRLVPVGGWGRPAQTLLPAITLALPYAAYIARLVRMAMLEALSEEFVRAARARGLSERQILLDHVLRHALLPVLSFLGPAAAAILTGSFVVEKIFAIPGLGIHVVESLHNRDQPLILAIVLLYGVFLAAFNLLVDLAYGWIDPRIRVGAQAS